MFSFSDIKTFSIFFTFFFCFFANTVFAKEVNFSLNDKTTEQNIYETVYGKRVPENLYLNIYESTKQELDQKTLERVAEQSNFEEADIKMFLKGEITESVKEKCQKLFQSNTSKDLYNCLGLLTENYFYEKKLITLETKLKGEANASEMWSDGDLNNSFFDIITDLNIIEVILFGENSYEFPFSDYYNFAETEKESDDSEKGENTDPTNAEQGADEQQNSDTNTEKEDKNQENPKEEINQKCQDPDAIQIKKSVWQTDKNSNQAENNGVSADSNSDNATWSIAQNSYIAKEYQFPKPKGECKGIGLFEGLLCIDPWPCNNSFCIKISFPPQQIGSGYATAVSVQEIVTAGLEQLNRLKGHTLTVHENSNERFFISVGKFLNRPIGLDVITQGIPVKFTPNKTSFDDATDGVNILGKFMQKIAEETGLSLEKNYDIVSNFHDKFFQMSTEAKDLQNQTYANFERSKKQLQKKLQEIRIRWKKSEKIKHTQNFWEEFRTHLNIMVLYFESIQEAFMKLETTGMEILEDTGQSCSAKH